ncbi:Basement membrane-specific heparan sulfate proteoglycan core protein, partial [Ophiophagus hannah]
MSGSLRVSGQESLQPGPGEALPKVMINIRTSVQTVLAGNAVEFECLAFGDPKPDLTWSKVGGQLRPGVLAKRVVPYFTQNPQSYLVLPTMKDAYRAFALEITFRPDTPDDLPPAFLPTEACGPDATCVNQASGEGYTCRCLLGRHGKKCMAGLTVTTPHFLGADAFISYPTLTRNPYELRLEVEVKPLSPNGLILFNGGDGTPVADFVSLNMANGHLEFRYELGSGRVPGARLPPPSLAAFGPSGLTKRSFFAGTAVLRSHKPLALGQWHKVAAERLNKDGTLQVDEERPVKRSSPGKSQGLNLHTSLYLGGVEDSIKLPAAANISSHFHGCIGEVSVNGKKVDISYSFLESRGISQCADSSPCDRRPCQHGGQCLLTGEYEFQCLCPDGFTGERCEVPEAHCQLHHPCLNGGICKGTACLCRQGFSGLYCEYDELQHQLKAEWPEGSGGNDAPGQYGAYFCNGGYVALPRHAFPR